MSQNNYPTECGANIEYAPTVESLSSSQNNYPTECGANSHKMAFAKSILSFFHLHMPINVKFESKVRKRGLFFKMQLATFNSCKVKNIEMQAFLHVKKFANHLSKNRKVQIIYFLDWYKFI